MNRYLLERIGIVLICGTRLLGEPHIVAAAGVGAPCHGKHAEKPCENCCEQCGCGMVRVCQVYCSTKTETRYEYCCYGKAICIPPVTPLCKNDGGPEGNGHCHKGCEEHCCVRDVQRLVKVPVTREIPVRECRLVWVCPRCKSARVASGDWLSFGVPVETTSSPPIVAPKTSNASPTVFFGIGARQNP